MCVKAKCRYCGCKVLSPMLGFLVLLFHTWYLYVFIESITQQWSKIIQGQALSMHVVLLKTWFQTNEQHRTAFLVVVGSCHRVGHSIHTLSSIQNPKSHSFGGNLRHSGITFVMCLPEMPVLWGIHSLQTWVATTFCFWGIEILCPLKVSAPWTWLLQSVTLERSNFCHLKLGFSTCVFQSVCTPLVILH